MSTSIPAKPPATRMPLRIAHASHPGLEYMTDSYFDQLRRCGYTAIYVQDSPFDHLTGNVAQFYRDFHLISLFDIARSFEKARYQDYINQVCVRAAAHGLRTFMQCHEPRMPYYAWSSTPLEWRGRGNWPHQGNSHIAFCWSVPEAVEYWKQMARDAFAALPGISGITMACMDNEAIPCDERCPRCKGQKVREMLRDVFGTFAEIGRQRGDNFVLGIVDWWLDQKWLTDIRKATDMPIYAIGHSCKGLTQEINGEAVPGAVSDMAMVSPRLSDLFLERKKFLRSVGFRVLDRIPWSHALENWWVPAPPSPRYAVEKLRNLDAQRDVEGWQDFDCGALEPGSIARAIEAWSADPNANVEVLVGRALEAIWGDEWKKVLPAYELFERGSARYPIAYSDAAASDFSGRNLAVQIPLVGPWFLEDFTFFDTLHATNWFAPWNLITPSSIEYVLPKVAAVAEALLGAFERIASVGAASPEMQLEKDAFEIHYRQYRSVANYFRLAQARWDHVHTRVGDEQQEQAVRRIAADELANHAAVELWLGRNPGSLHNPCHSLIGKLQACWPDMDFTLDMLQSKRRSLERLLVYQVGAPKPLSRRLSSDSTG